VQHREERQQRYKAIRALHEKGKSMIEADAPIEAYSLVFIRPSPPQQNHRPRSNQN
jgi:hypothetical protein